MTTAFYVLVILSPRRSLKRPQKTKPLDLKLLELAHILAQ